MDLQLGGKTAYVTGGAKGIGEAIADLLAAEGVRVVVSDVDEQRLRQNRDDRWGPDAVTITADLAGPGATLAAEQVLELLGSPPDILINNVGAARPAAFEAITDADWQANYELNFMSHVRTSRVLLPQMAKAGGGSAIFLASDLAKQPEDVPIEYATAKVALVGLTKMLSLAYAPAVRVNALCPGPIWTDLWTKPGGVADGLSEAYGLPRDQAVQKFISERHLPLGIGEPTDVAAMAAFISSPRSKHITAAAISIDGGGVRALF
jgi:NAD(P)-dependent dehydrogenase (short-subunit alcohol dehydrogenase family)